MTREPLTAAIETSRRWYDSIFALHRVPVRSDDRLWAALGDPPPWHSAVKTLTPDIDADSVLAAMDRHPHGSVADSFGVLDLGEHGFDLLIDATWVHHAGVADATWPAEWSIVVDPGLLADWCRHHDYVGVLPPAVLSDPAFHVLARIADGEPVAGAIVHDAGEVAGLSNLWSSSDPLTPADDAELLACASVLHPGRPVTDYAWGDELDVHLAAGFTSVGSQRVWER
jgi:hypothetical protein